MRFQPFFGKNAELYNKLITGARLCLLDMWKGFHPPNLSVTLCCPAFGTRRSECYDRADANKLYRWCNFRSAVMTSSIITAIEGTVWLSYYWKQIAAWIVISTRRTSLCCALRVCTHSNQPWLKCAIDWWFNATGICCSQSWDKEHQQHRTNHWWQTAFDLDTKEQLMNSPCT